MTPLGVVRADGLGDGTVRLTARREGGEERGETARAIDTILRGTDTSPDRGFIPPVGALASLLRLRLSRMQRWLDADHPGGDPDLRRLQHARLDAVHHARRQDRRPRDGRRSDRLHLVAPFFGGAVDGDHLVSYEAGDDHFDMSDSYSGRLQYLIPFQITQLAQRSGAGTPSADPEGIENDGCNGTGCTTGFSTQPYTLPVLANFTLVGTGSTATSGTSGGTGMMLRRGTGGYYSNGIVARYPRAGVRLRDAETYARAGAATIEDVTTADLAVKNVLFAEAPVIFPAPSGTTVQSSLDTSGHVLTNSTVAAASLFAAVPATTTAWSPRVTRCGRCSLACPRAPRTWRGSDA